MNTATAAKAIEDANAIDMLDTSAKDILASSLRECMVLMDPELGTPAVWLDHKVRATRSSGQVTWAAHDLETGRLVTINLRSTMKVSVLA
jgi:hypothetical protein